MNPTASYLKDKIFNCKKKILCFTFFSLWISFFVIFLIGKIFCCSEIAPRKITLIQTFKPNNEMPHLMYQVEDSVCLKNRDCYSENIISQFCCKNAAALSLRNEVNHNTDFGNCCNILAYQKP